MFGQRLLQLILVIFFSILVTLASFYSTNLRAKDDLTSAPDLAVAENQAQPLLDALEKYHSDEGFYPTSLNQITPVYLPQDWGASRYHYSARRWTLKSDDCAAREKSLHGWIMKKEDEYAKEVAQFKFDCISGYNDYQLQSPDFHPSAQSPDLERWAYYESFSKKWSLGWCLHHRSVHGGHLQDTAINGACRSRQDRRVFPDPWQD